MAARRETYARPVWPLTPPSGGAVSGHTSAGTGAAGRSLSATVNRAVRFVSP
jgi:hypothetical protein